MFKLSFFEKRALKFLAKCSTYTILHNDIRSLAVVTDHSIDKKIIKIGYQPYSFNAKNVNITLEPMIKIYTFKEFYKALQIGELYPIFDQNLFHIKSVDLMAKTFNYFEYENDIYKYERSDSESYGGILTFCKILIGKNVETGEELRFINEKYVKTDRKDDDLDINDIEPIFKKADLIIKLGIKILNKLNK